jgi:hypothetical protein
MQSRVGKHQVKFFSQVDFSRIYDLKFQVGDFLGRKRFSGIRDHFRGNIRSHCEAVGQSAGDFRRDLAITATHIEQMFVAAQVKRSDEFARPTVLHGGIRRVIGGIPSG